MDNQVEQVSAPVLQAIERLHVNAVFGTPVTQGSTTIIPVASIGYGLGYGFGGGSDTTAEQRGEGGGAGGGGSAVPRGYIRLNEQGASFEPILDQTRIALSSIAMSMWIVFWVAWTIRAVAKRRKKA